MVCDEIPTVRHRRVTHALVCDNYCRPESLEFDGQRWRTVADVEDVRSRICFRSTVRINSGCLNSCVLFLSVTLLSVWIFNLS